MTSVTRRIAGFTILTLLVLGGTLAAFAGDGPAYTSGCINNSEPGRAFGQPLNYDQAYSALYGSVPHGCQTCHNQTFTAKNPYGAVLQATAGANITARMQAIENGDADGDGTSNKDEALAGRNPGDPTDAPPPSGPTYTGSFACSTCHLQYYSTWQTTLHTSIYMPVTDENILPTWSGTISVEQTASGTTPARPPIWVQLDQEGNNFYVRLYRDNGVTPLTGSLEIVRVHGGHPVAENGWDNGTSPARGTPGYIRGLRSTGTNPIAPGGPDYYPGEATYIGKQRYQVEFGDQHYILPIQYNPIRDLDNKKGGWVAYNVHNWIDASYNLVLNASQSEERKCAGCHQTGIVDVTYDAGSMATIPGTAYNITGAYNLVGNPTVEENIGCEACHGPGSDHIGGGFTAGPGSREIINPAFLTWEQQTDSCGFCHSRGLSTGTVNSTTLEYPYRATAPHRPVPGDVWGDFYVEGGGYWPDGIHARQHHQQYEEFMNSPHFGSTRTAQSCSAAMRISTGFIYPGCHEPHGRTGDRDIDTSDGVGYVDIFDDGIADEHDLTMTARGVTTAGQSSPHLCLNCHQARAFPRNTDTDRERHYWHDPQSTRGTPDCTNCHMPAMAASGVNYDMHSHVFDVVEPEQTITYVQPNSCAILCHRTFGMPIADTNIGVWNDPSDLANSPFLQEHIPGATLTAQYLTGAASVEALVEDIPAYAPAFDPNRDTNVANDASPFLTNAADVVRFVRDGRP